MTTADEHLRAALEAAGIGTWVWEKRTGRVSWSPTMERLCGLRPGSFGGTFQAFLECVHPEERESLARQISASCKAGDDHHREFRVVWPDGSVHRLMSHARPVFDASGDPVSLTGVTQDVTAQREAEESIRVSEARYRSLVLATSQTVWSSDPEGRVVEDSPSWRAFTGQSFEQFRGYGWIDVIHPDERERIWQIWGDVRATRIPRDVEYRVRRHDGVYRDLLVRCAPVLGADGRILEWSGATSDITERKQTEREIAEQRARLAAVLDAMPSGVMIAEAPSRSISYANKQAEAILRGSSRGVRTIMTGRLRRARRLDGTEVDPDELPIARALACGEVTRAVELAFEAGDGSIVYLRSNGAPVFDGSGRVAAAVCGFEDITGEIEAKQARDRTDRFRELFVGMLGHDLRNPLSSIIGGASLLRCRGALAPDDVRVVERIANAGQRMRRMIEQILDLTRSRLGGGIPIAPEKVNLHELVRRIAEELEAANPDRSIRVSASGDPEGIWDPDRLGQVISNLLGNALEHAGSSCPVDIDIERVGDTVALAVHNGGSPIPVDLLPVIFDPFRRSATAERRRANSGLGLGLYISQQIVASHGGTLAVDSTAERGTTFTVTLPAVARSLPPAS
jgi:PAS domain S-box-containing protein